MDTFRETRAVIARTAVGCKHSSRATPDLHAVMVKETQAAASTAQGLDWQATEK
jgi:hypothetical protein